MTITPEILRITVLAGGASAERDVSLDSGRAVADALKKCGHAVALADINPDDLCALDIPADVVFPVLHGGFGEDGRLQAVMQQRGLCFVGSGAKASATAMDKVATKRLAIELDIPTPRFEVIAPPDKPKLTPPVVVKPVAEGSSVGTSIVRNASTLEKTVAAVADQFDEALVEQYIDGVELTVGFLGNQALPPIRIQPRQDFYDFEAKYQDDHTEYLFETGLARETLERAAEWSSSIYAGLGCRHLSRIDWMVDSRERLWFLEVNTIPGFTTHSLVPKAAAKIGLTFEQLVDKLVRMAMEDHS